MRNILNLLLAAVVLVAFFGRAAQAHELWIEPVSYLTEGRVEARLVNGQNFGGVGGAGVPMAFIPQWFVRFDLVLGDAVVPVAGRMGDMPALAMDPLGEGLHVAVYQSSGDIITYDTWEKFTTFLDHKGLQAVGDTHAARGLGREDFKEYYTRFSKSLIGVGAGAGADRALGLEAELVALDNPYVIGGDAVRVQFTYQGTPRAMAQVELFEKAADGTVVRSAHMTDDQGVAILPVRPGFAYMADAVVIREPEAGLAADKGVVWETLWANLTFAVP